jgi:hypothetical protein
MGYLLVPRSIVVGPDAATSTALFFIVCLFALFGVQHSVLARPGF